MHRLLFASLIASTTLTLFACSPATSEYNDDELAAEADGYVRHYEPILDGYSRRLQHIYQASGQVPKNLPGSDDAIRVLVDARDRIVALRRYRKDEEKLAPERVAKHDHDGLMRLAEDLGHKYADGCTVVNDDLSSVESWMTDAMRNAPPPTPGAAQPPAPADIPEGMVP